MLQETFRVGIGGPRLRDSRSRGSDHRERDSGCGEPTVPFINFKSFAGNGGCEYAGGGEHFPACRACSGIVGSRARRQKPIVYIPTGLARKFTAAGDSRALVLAFLCRKLSQAPLTARTRARVRAPAGGAAVWKIQ